MKVRVPAGSRGLLGGGDAVALAQEPAAAPACAQRLPDQQPGDDDEDQDTYHEEGEGNGLHASAYAPGRPERVGLARRQGFAAGGAVSGMDLTEAEAACGRVLDAVGEAVVADRSFLETVLLGVLARGHVLLEDAPGTGKTLTARSTAGALGLTFSRIQFTPDLLPADVTGTHVYDESEAEFRFEEGPVFANVVLADEINRAPPKTQSALLEAMEERQVTADGETRPLPEPFFVIATQNPIEQEGTFPLPEAQIDRFAVKTSIGYPDAAGEVSMLRRRAGREARSPSTGAVLSPERVRALQAVPETMRVDDDLLEVVDSLNQMADRLSGIVSDVADQTGNLHDSVESVANTSQRISSLADDQSETLATVSDEVANLSATIDVARATREDGRVGVGVSPRGTQRLFEAARARAVIEGREYATPDHVAAVAPAVLAHRLVLTPDARVGGTEKATVVADVLDRVAVPTVEA